MQKFDLKYSIVRFLCTLISCLIYTNLSAEGTNSTDPAIEGYSPVSYFTKNTAEKGSPDYQVTNNGQVYYLVSAEQVDLFNANPEKYKPRFAAFCPYSLALGKRVPIDPTIFKIVAGNLLLFHKTEDINGLTLWNNADNEAELLDRANQEFLRIRFH
jgi:YHS domain-containing protein